MKNKITITGFTIVYFSLLINLLQSRLESLSIGVEIIMIIMIIIYGLFITILSISEFKKHRKNQIHEWFSLTDNQRLKISRKDKINKILKK